MRLQQRRLYASQTHISLERENQFEDFLISRPRLFITCNTGMDSAYTLQLLYRQNAFNKVSPNL